MKQDHLIMFFRHVSDREQSHGIENAFRFKSVLSGRKKGSLLPAQYGASADGTSVVTTTSGDIQPKLGDSDPSESAPVRHARVTLATVKSAGANGTSVVATTSGDIQPKSGDPGPSESAPVRRARVKPRLRGPATLGPATASSTRLQTSDLLALEEAKKLGVSGKRQHW